MNEENDSFDLSQYSLIFQIGEGGFSKVYRVMNKMNGKYYAAKICTFMVDEDTRDDTETLLLFRELNLMSLLNHPSIIRLIGYCPNNFSGDPFPTVITEYASNGSLRNIIELENSGLSPDE